MPTQYTRMYDEEELTCLIRDLKRGTTYDYSCGNAHNMDGLMDEAAEAIQWCLNQLKEKS